MISPRRARRLRPRAALTGNATSSEARRERRIAEGDAARRDAAKLRVFVVRAPDLRAAAAQVRRRARAGAALGPHAARLSHADAVLPHARPRGLAGEARSARALRNLVALWRAREGG